MDENKDMPNEETQATPEQPAEVKEEPDVAEEVAQEPVQQEPDAAGGENEAAPALTDAPLEEAVAQSSEEGQPPVLDEMPATVEEPSQGAQAVPQAEAIQSENPDQATDAEPDAPTDEALVEMLDAAQPAEAEQKPAEGEQPAATTEGIASASSEVPPASSLQPPAPEASPTIESVIEAVLFATDEPLPEGKLAGIVEITGKQIRDSVESLNTKYQANGNAFRIEQIAGGYQMLTQPIYNSWLKKMVKVRSDNKLSPAAMETLAIIAYKQPIIRADIEAIRGVAVGEVIRSLMYKGLVKIAGRAEILGRPMLYGTTKKVLEIFGLNSVKDLPKAEDLKNPDRG
ncbi:MAG: SMC-Scp complex subunit ScpB [Solirubrobacterales bacterium]